ncbi:GMC family oxidoreductase [Bradyrhizobium sp. CCBAU 51745]|uniref:GMC oxidoreductase n=1 Tax=Bradyrhizobium sp. CCBAU 51745 TaxID=1325099 RepID=UPI002306984C|nr:GMC family oxidoreductase [Bradyrhizobium sp. CCBAU 51745]MDA9438763.1 GMC family oxidoreductase [Bradyrhizobium sp. CCBAU 51745]
MKTTETADVLVIGSGMGGATFAAGLAPTGAKIVILERGQRLRDCEAARDARAIFQRGVFRPQESWLDGAGQAFNPGNYYYVGGNTKLYGAVLIRYRAEDFAPIAHRDGTTPGWPFSYGELEPWYSRAEQLYNVRGALGDDSSEPFHSAPYPFGPVPDEPAIAVVRQRLKKIGLNPFSLPLGIDIETWLKRAKTPWDAFPDAGHGKMDAESCGLACALAHDNVELREEAQVERLVDEPDGKRIAGVEVIQAGERRMICAGIIVLAAGAVNSAALLLRSSQAGIANRSDAVGRYFMNHNSSAVLAIDPRVVNDSVYQKTIGINDYYLDDGRGGPPLGNVQLLGRVTAPILKANMPFAPERALGLMSRHAVDWYAMSEDLPSAESRVTVDGANIRLDWQRSNWTTHLALVATLKERLRAAGYPIVLSKAFDRRTPSHQCGTVRIGLDPATSPLDPFCRAFDHPNLFVVDASFLPTSAAVNPSLTIAAQALRVADHVARTDLRTHKDMR